MKPRIVSALVLSTLGFSSAALASGFVDVPSHVVTADGAGLADMAPGSPPSPAHPEGTLFARPRVQADVFTLGRLALVDVATSHVLHQASLACEALDQGTDHERTMLAVCGGSLVAFDAATLQVRWKTPLRGCAAQRAVMSNIVTTGAGLIAVASACDRVFVNVADASTGALLGATDTGLDAEERWFSSSATILSHGSTIAVSSWIMNGPRAIVVLSPRYDAVAHRLALGFLQDAWDDGTHLHIRQWVKGPLLYAPGAASSAGRGPAWLSAGRDYTVTDSLAPIAWTRIGQEPIPTAYRPSSPGAGGDYFASEMQMGAQHFWLTLACCGDDVPGGVMTGTVPAP